MKFSVLLPTRDRLDLLRLAIASVQRQDDADWEIVVSDNASTQDVRAFVHGLADPRIVYRRQEVVVPVTDNWNAALEASTGDYVIMLGDDDALMPGCLAELRRLVTERRDPAAVYMQAWQYAYPGVIPGHAEGMVQRGFCEFLPSLDGDAFELPGPVSRRMVAASMAFRIRYGFNMQHFAVSRSLVRTLQTRGPFFQSPYPDYYAANAIMLASPRILAVPRPLTVIGMSPKSFGYYYFNGREGEGVQFLQHRAEDPLRRQLRKQFVPGTDMNDSWLCAMESLASMFPEAGLRPDYRRYRLLQYRALARGGVGAVLRHLRPADVLPLTPMLAAYVSAWLLPPALRNAAQDRIRASLSAYPRFDLQRRAVPYRDILEAACALANE